VSRPNSGAEALRALFWAIFEKPTGNTMYSFRNLFHVLPACLSRASSQFNETMILLMLAINQGG